MFENFAQFFENFGHLREVKLPKKLGEVFKHPVN
jgi:hypothetical protein